jgi:hypothetical protein
MIFAQAVTHFIRNEAAFNLVGMPISIYIGRAHLLSEKKCYKFLILTLFLEPCLILKKKIFIGT